MGVCPIQSCNFVQSWAAALCIVCVCERVWQVVCDPAGNFQVHMYQQGYLRLASRRFTMEIPQNKGKQFDAVHNTNTIKQSRTKFFGRTEPGNLAYFDDLAVCVCVCVARLVPPLCCCVVFVHLFTG